MQKKEFIYTEELKRYAICLYNTLMLDEAGATVKDEDWEYYENWMKKLAEDIILMVSKKKTSAGQETIYVDDEWDGDEWEV